MTENAVDAKLIEEYIAEQPEDRQAILRKVHETIDAAIGQYTATMAYGMPTYRDRRNIIHFASQKHHLGIYPGSQAIVQFAEELKPYKTSKGAIQFPFDKPIPYELIGRIAKWGYEQQS